MDIQQMFNDSLVRMHDEGKVQEIIDKQVLATVESQMKDLLGSWSPLSKAIEKELKEKLQINLESLDIPSYNEVLSNAIKKQLDDAIYTKGLEDFNERVSKVLGTDMKNMKLSELVKEMAKEIEDLEDYDHDAMLEMSLHVEESTYSKSTYHVYMDSNPEKEKHECKYRLFISDNKLSSVTIDAKEKYSANRHYSKVTPRILMEGKMSNLEELLFKAYVHGIEIEIDEAHCNTEIYVEDIREED